MAHVKKIIKQTDRMRKRDIREQNLKKRENGQRPKGNKAY